MIDESTAAALAIMLFVFLPILVAAGARLVPRRRKRKETAEWLQRIVL